MEMSVYAAIVVVVVLLDGTVLRMSRRFSARLLG